MKLYDYTTTTGVAVKLRPIAPNYIEKIRQQIDWPQPPTYDVEVLGGAKETIYHTADSIETDEEKAQWAEFERKRDAANLEFFKKRSYAITRRCILVDLPEDNAWITLQQQDGITVPEDPELRRQHYIETEVIGNDTDLFFITNAVQRLARFDEEDYRQAMEFFRDNLAGNPDS